MVLLMYIPPLRKSNKKQYAEHLALSSVRSSKDKTSIFCVCSGQIKTEGCCGPCAPPLAYQSLVLRTTKSANYTTQFSWSGFRYIQISSLPPGWEINVYAIPLMTNLEWTTTFESSNSHLNDIYEMCQNTHASNMMGIQSDCPHRERFGYTGDALATLPTSLAFFDGSSFYEKRLYDVLDSLRSNGGVTVRYHPSPLFHSVVFPLGRFLTQNCCPT